MKKIKKTKANKIKAAVPKRKKIRQYEAHYLPLALVALLLVEGFFGTAIHASDWKQGLAVLDISQTVAQTSSDVAMTLRPVGDGYNGVEQFYQVAATQMAQLLDLSQNNPIDQVALIGSSVNEFYQQAATQMASMLDFSANSSSSSNSPWSSRVAGSSISR
jgi:hypothetical protein